MKTWLITLPLLCLAGVAVAQEAAPAEAEPVQVRTQDQVQEKAQVQEQAKPRMKQRQGADVRHCLDKKDNKAIIRCSEAHRRQ